MKTSTKTLLASASILILTVFHHFYAAAIFDSPWRRHVAVIVMPVLLVMIVLYVLYQWRPLAMVGKTSLWLFMLVALLVPIAWLGFFHGGYTHLVKLILVFGGVSQATFGRLCPVCELPGDVIYEVTGVMEFLLSLVAAFYLFKLWQDSRGVQRAI
jgi:hypothetical protein